MALTVTFTSKTPVSTGGTSYYQVWTYTVQASPPNDLNPNQRIALALPSDIDVQDPRRYPDVAALNGAFLEHDAAVSRQYAGKVISSSSSTQTISFVAPAAQSDRELLLVSANMAGRPWTVQPFAVTPGGPSANTQTLQGPSRGGRTTTGRPLTEFVGTLPYASESFGLIQPLLGWRSQRTVARFVDALRRADDLLLATVSQFVAPQATYVPGEPAIKAADTTADAEGDVTVAGTSDSLVLKTGNTAVTSSTTR